MEGFPVEFTRGNVMCLCTTPPPAKSTAVDGNGNKKDRGGVIQVTAKLRVNVRWIDNNFAVVQFKNGFAAVVLDNVRVHIEGEGV